MFMRYILPEISRKIADVAGMDLEIIRRMIIDENIRRLKSGLYMKAFDWDDIITGVQVSIGVEDPVLFSDEVIKFSRMASPKPGVEEAFRRIKSEEGRMSLVTNGFLRYVLPILSKAGILEFFDRIVTPDQTGYIKPMPEIFLAAAGRNEKIVHVGDSVSLDICGARRAGFDSALVMEIPPTLSELDPMKRVYAAAELIRKKFEMETYSFLVEGPCLPSYLIADIRELLYLMQQ
jgi:HAD superfamily hydrolase (TIGR01549 family)